MTKINYQALRAKAEKATCGVWSLEYGEGRFDGDDALIHREAAGYIPICRIEGAHPESGFDEDFQIEQQANAEFIAAANPATVLALLDELEAAEKQILKLEKLAVAESVGADKAAASCVEWMKRCHDAEKRIAELSASHRKLRNTMAGIHNTIRMDGGYTPLAAILNAAKRAYEESASAAGIRIKGE
ncbi:ead/Ea22-like family protein [Escherichia coli]|nr:ead/Ea22-like family protein [Escherichia coli]HDW3616170.1 ead/Ea22-like family protein [Escherichia coli]